MTGRQTVAVFDDNGGFLGWFGPKTTATVWESEDLDPTRLYALKDGSWVMVDENAELLGRPAARAVSPQEALEWLARHGHPQPPQLSKIAEEFKLVSGTIDARDT